MAAGSRLQRRTGTWQPCRPARASGCGVRQSDLVLKRSILAACRVKGEDWPLAGQQTEGQLKRCSHAPGERGPRMNCGEQRG